MVEWLRAQLDEDEQRAADVHDRGCDAVRYVEGEPLFDPCDCGWPARVLAEVTAKRAILNYFDRLDTHVLDNNCWAQPGTEEARAHLAAPYADQPGYREEWRP